VRRLFFNEADARTYFENL